jgi:hypothetical protein
MSKYEHSHFSLDLFSLKTFSPEKWLIFFEKFHGSFYEKFIFRGKKIVVHTRPQFKTHVCEGIFSLYVVYLAIFFCCHLAVPYTPCWGPQYSQIWPFVICREPISINNNGADRNGTP